MRAVVQRVSQAAVATGAERCAEIGPGLLILLGVARDDDEPAATWLAERCARLRIFGDAEGRMNRSLLDVGGSALVVSQFTLCADTTRGLRPSFDPAAPPELAQRLYECFVQECRRLGVPTGTGSFGAHMKVRLENDGPVTFVLDTREARSEKRDARSEKQEAARCSPD